MSEIDKYKGEYTMLSYLVTCAERAREIMRRATVNESMFSSDENRAAFIALMAEPTTDDTLLLCLAAKALPALSGDPVFTAAFLGLSDNPGALEYETEQFVETAIMRDHAQKLHQTFLQYGGQQAEFLLDVQQNISRETQARIDALRAQFPMARLGTAPGADATPSAALDESLLHIPGFVDEVVEYSMRAAQRPNRVLAFAGALALLAHLTGRHFVGPGDARTNIYLVALADSGTGKDAPRKLNRKIASEENIAISVQNDVTSGQGLEDALKRAPALLLQMDEFDTVLNVLKDEKGNRQTGEAMWKVMLTMFSSSGSDYTTRLKAESARGGGGGEVIHSPSLTMFATAVTSRFYGSLCERALTNGFLARCLVFEAGQRGEYNPDAGLSKNEIPSDMRYKLRHLFGFARNFTDNKPVDPRDLISVPFADGAAKEVEKANIDADRLYDKAVRDGDDMGKAVWSRSVELTMKFALLYAISEGLYAEDSFAISPNAVSWAWRLVKALQLRMLDMVAANTAETEFEGKVKKAYGIIRKAGKKGISRTSLSQRFPGSPRELDDIEAILLEREEITATSLPRGRNGKSAKLYIAIKKGK